MKRKTLKLKIAFWTTLFFGVSAAYLFWLLWQRLTLWIGNTTLAITVVAVIVLVGILLGQLSLTKLAKKFK